ncbi:hypothetical protein FKM82_017409 [Ascaphus truei]
MGPGIEFTSVHSLVRPSALSMLKLLELHCIKIIQSLAIPGVLNPRVTSRPGFAGTVPFFYSEMSRILPLVPCARWRRCARAA